MLDRERETLENDALADRFQAIMIEELQRRGVHFTKATAENFLNVNIDVHIWIEAYDMRYLFKYIGIGWLTGRELNTMTLEEWVKDYVRRELKELKQSVEYNLKDIPKRLENRDLTQSYWADLVRELEDTQKIAEWLFKIEDL